MLTFQVESWAAYRAECGALWREHYDEIARDKDRMPMRPDEALYEALDAAGSLHVLTARDAGLMVGYQITVVRPHPHYADVLCGFEDAYFLSAPYRKGMAGVKMIRAAVDTLRARGVRKVFFHTKAFKNLGRIFEFLGFVKSDEIYSRWV